MKTINLYWRNALTLTAVCLLLCLNVLAQDDKSKRPSPPAKATGKAGTATVTIDYSQPSVKGRNVWDPAGRIAPYGKVWRTGANEATTFEVDKNVKIEGKDLAAGKYSLYTIPGENEWTVIFNKVSDQWGTKYDEKQDALRVKVKPAKAPSFQEQLTFAVDPAGMVAMRWENKEVRFKVSSSANSQ